MDALRRRSIAQSVLNVTVIVLVDMCLVRGLSLEKDLVTLSEILPGVYSNSKQYTSDAAKTLQPSRGHMLMTTVIRPVEVPSLGKAYNVFVEQYNGKPATPYRQRLHSFSVDNSQRAIRLRIYSFANVSLIPRLAINLKLFRNLSQSDLVAQEGCDMFWRRLKKNSFVGATGRTCLGSIRREPVRISVSTTLTPKMLMTHEGLYRVKDGSKVMRAEIPYNLIKVKKITGASYIPRPDIFHSRSSRHLNQVQNDIPQEHVNKRSRKPRRQKHDALRLQEYISSMPSSKSAWPLRHFRSLLDALTSGRAVYFVMELKGCTLPSQAKIERTSFGDSIDVFEHIRQVRGRKREYIKFTQKKFQQGTRGYETVIREITVFRNGRVIVRLRKTRPDRVVPATYAANCKLYDHDARTGDIKFSTDPFKNIKKIKSFGFLRSSLRKGRRVRMSVDFSKCSGVSGSTINQIGGEVRGYDFVNSGRAIEFSLVRNEIDLSRDGASQRFLLGRVLHTGDVIFIDMTDEHMNSLEQNEQHFRCSIKGNKANVKPGEKSVKFYYL